MLVIDKIESFIADHPIVFIVILFAMREVYNLTWKHNSTRVDWNLPATDNWLDFLEKISLTIGIAVFLGLCSLLIVIPLFKILNQFRSYLLKKIGHGDMQYHTVQIK